MTDVPDDILDDPFHGAALAAFVELATACGGVPEVEATRRLAFRDFEEALAQKHAQSAAAEIEPQCPRIRSGIQRPK